MYSLGVRLLCIRGSSQKRKETRFVLGIRDLGMKKDIRQQRMERLHFQGWKVRVSVQALCSLEESSSRPGFSGL